MLGSSPHYDLCSQGNCWQRKADIKRLFYQFEFLGFRCAFASQSGPRLPACPQLPARFKLPACRWQEAASHLLPSCSCLADAAACLCLFCSHYPGMSDPPREDELEGNLWLLRWVCSPAFTNNCQPCPRLRHLVVCH